VGSVTTFHEAAAKTTCVSCGYDADCHCGDALVSVPCDCGESPALCTFLNGIEDKARVDWALALKRIAQHIDNADTLKALEAMSELSWELWAAQMAGHGLLTDSLVAQLPARGTN